MPYTAVFDLKKINTDIMLQFETQLFRRLFVISDPITLTKGSSINGMLIGTDYFGVCDPPKDVVIADFNRHLTDVEIESKNYSKAEKQFKKAVELNAEFSDRAAQRYMQSAIESMNKGDSKSAIKLFTAAAFHKPSLKLEIEKICERKANASLKVMMWSQGYHPSETDIQIGCLNECFKTTTKDKDGILNLTTTNIKSKFLENEMAGRLFIIEGEVRNGYNESRSMIHLRGSLFVKGRKLAGTEYTYSGVLVSSKDLAALPIEEIRKQTRSQIDPKITTVEAKQTFFDFFGGHFLTQLGAVLLALFHPLISKTIDTTNKPWHCLLAGRYRTPTLLQWQTGCPHLLFASLQSINSVP